MANPYAGPISNIESGGRYDLLGPVTKSGDRAYGRYQVMGKNVPQWTQQHFGQSLTPEQFLANPQAQDAVFNGQFGQYVQKYGPEGAARAWFAGEGGMNDPNRKDMLGTSVASYAKQFTNGLGQQDNSAQSAPSLTPGSPAPPLPAPVDVAGPAPQNNAPAGLLAGGQQPPGQPGGLLGNPMQLASLGMGMMSGQGLLGGMMGGSQKAMTAPQPAIAPAMLPQQYVTSPRSQVDLSPLLQFLQARQQSAPASWST